MSEYGFVYLWFDRKHKRYYIGCHWGNENDGYICSSSWMKRSYKTRPFDFKRRILSKIYTNRKDMFDEESRWQSMISDDELAKKYYNIKRHGDRHWSTNEEKRLTVGQKISLAPGRGKKISEAKTGISKSEEHKRKISETLKNRPLSYTRSEETRQKISENSNRLQKEGKIGMLGKSHSNETKKKMSQNNAMSNSISRSKIGQANRGKVGLWINNQKKMAKPGTELYDSLLALGYKPKKEII